MNEFFLLLRNWWFFIFIAVLLFSFWRLAKWVDSTIDTCPFCRGSGKQWDSVHDSHDLQTVNCEYCQGTGKKPKKA